MARSPLVPTIPTPVSDRSTDAVVDVDQLQADPHNRRRHTERNLAMVADALRDVGAARSIVVDEDDVVLAGNGVIEGAKRAGLTKVRIIDADGTEVIAVRRRGLSPEQKRALAIYDNRSAELAEWNPEQLRLDADAGLDLQPFWSATELQDIIGTKAGLTDPDRVPVLRPTDIRVGDLFALGPHRLLCDDALAVAAIARLLGDDRAAMVFTDPPYGMNLDTDFSGMVGMAAGNTYRPVVGDDQPYDPSHIITTFARCPEIVLWGADYYAERLPQRNAGSWFVWDKANGGDAPNDDYDKMFGSNFELAWSKAKHKRALIRILWKGFFGLAAEDTKHRVHPTQKPVALGVWFLDRFTVPSAVVVDVFLGSGSTVIAAEQTSRRCVGMEIDPRYCQVVIDRWEAFTGLTATKIGDAIRP